MNLTAADIEIPEPVDMRTSPRHEVTLPVTFEFEGERFDVRSVNVSTGGIFLQTVHAPPREALLDLRIELGADRVLELKGTVVHLGGGAGIGVRFDRVDDYVDELAALERFLAQLEAPVSPV